MSPRQFERPTLTVGGRLTLRGCLRFTETIGPSAVLFVHGFGSQCDGEKFQALEGSCAALGWTLAAFNLRGHGDSDGTLADLSGSAVQEDLDAIWSYLTGRGVRKLFLVGSSMGGWAAGWFAVRHPEVVSACAAIAPAFAFPRFRWERLTEEERQRWQQQRLVPVRNEARGTDEQLDFALIEEMPRFHPGLLASRWSGPLLLFHGMLDDVVPFTASLAFVEQLAAVDAALVLYRTGDHRLHSFRHEMAREICQFFQRFQGG